jgi:hypothetical protein
MLEFSEETSLTNELTQETSGSACWDGVGVAALFLNPKEADFLSLLRSSPFTPHSSFQVGEPQSERPEDILLEGLEGKDSP